MATHPDRSRWLSALVGAASAVLAVVVTLSGFYPIGRLFDPTIGGDVPTGLGTEVVLGVIGGFVVSPLAALIGAAVGWRLQCRPLSVATGVVVVVLAVGVAVGLFVLLNGGVAEQDGSQNSLLFVATLGAIAGFLGATLFAVSRRVLKPIFVPAAATS